MKKKLIVVAVFLLVLLGSAVMCHGSIIVLIVMTGKSFVEVGMIFIWQVVMVTIGLLLIKLSYWIVDKYDL